MPFNGGRSCINFNFLHSGGTYVFRNLLKQGQTWQLVGGGYPEPTIFDSNGYPTTVPGSGIYTTFIKPSSTERPGDYVIKWTGTAAGTIGALSFSGENGREVFAQPSSMTLTITSASSLTNMVVCHEDDEAGLDAGDIFQEAFLDICREYKWGVYRFLDWQLGNSTNVRCWADRKPDDYVYYYGDECRASIYAGETTNSGNDYSCSAPSGWGGLVDKAIVTARYNATASSDTPTLNVGGSGAKTIRHADSRALNFFGGTTQRPYSGSIATLVFDAELDCWLQRGGGSNGVAIYLTNAMPISVMLRLCTEMGAYPFFVPPYLSCDSTDWITGLATYVEANQPDWMIPRYEVAPNETWNTAAGFFATPYAIAKGTALWGTQTTPHQWVGKVASILGEAVSAVYGDDRSRYWAVLGVQQQSTPSASNPRAEANLYVSEDDGEPASDWVTHVASAHYFRSTYTSEEKSAAATAYAEGDDAEKAEIASEYAASCAIDLGGSQYAYSTPRMRTYTDNWETWANGYGFGQTFYEGGWDEPNGSSELTALNDAARMAPEMQNITRDLYVDLVAAGGEFPAHLYLAGPSSQGPWGLMAPNTYATPSPQAEGIRLFNHRQRAITLT